MEFKPDDIVIWDCGGVRHFVRLTTINDCYPRFRGEILWCVSLVNPAIKPNCNHRKCLTVEEEGLSLITDPPIELLEFLLKGG